MTTKRWIPLAVLWLFAAAACSDFSTAPTRVPTEFTMSPDSILLTEGETGTFQFTVLDQDGEAYAALPSWASPVWTFSDDSILQVDAEGVAEALGPGEVVATAHLAGMTVDAVAQVNPSELTVSVPFSRITQGTQTYDGTVPLVAGRDGLLRVYVLSDKPNFFQPTAVAMFYQGSAVVFTDTLELEHRGLPQNLAEGKLELSFDGDVPGSVLQPGMSLVVQIDPEGVLPATGSSVLRIPESGVRMLNVVDVPPFRMRLVPVTQSISGATSRFSTTDPMNWVGMTQAVFPMSEFDVDVRAPFTTDADLTTQEGWYQLIEDMATLRLDDGSPRYYYGGFSLPQGAYAAGLGYVGYPVAIGTDGTAETIAHEIGHTLSLPHAPCGGPASPDPNYPYVGGVIGRWGWDPRTGVMYNPQERYDLMTYCDPTWISDYNYVNVMEYRDTSSYDAVFAAGADRVAAREDVLIVSAGVRDGQVHLGPVLESVAPPSMPTRRDGRYTLEGLAEDGAVLFTLPFEPRALDHELGALFSAAIPATVAQPDRLARLRVTGPEGRVERRRSPGTGTPRVTLASVPGADRAVARWDARTYPLAVVRDRSTGRIVALSRNGELDLPGDASGLDVTLSDGVRAHTVEMERQ